MDEVHKASFHTKDGLYFKRGEGGTVSIYAEKPGEITLDASAWASVVASVSAGGEGYLSHRSALGFHIGADEMNKTSINP